MIVFSILNRLVDDPDPAVPLTAGQDRTISRPRQPVVTKSEFERYREAVRQDLKWLLNTRRIADTIPEGLHELERSVYSYGLPDFSQMKIKAGRNDGDQLRLAGVISRTIEIFEPRILGVQVTVEKQAEGRELYFRISGKLKMKPRPEPIRYDTMFDAISGEYAVEVPGDAGA